MSSSAVFEARKRQMPVSVFRRNPEAMQSYFLEASPRRPIGLFQTILHPRHPLIISAGSRFIMRIERLRRNRDHVPWLRRRPRALVPLAVPVMHARSGSRLNSLSVSQATNTIGRRTGSQTV